MYIIEEDFTINYCLQHIILLGKFKTEFIPLMIKIDGKKHNTLLYSKSADKSESCISQYFNF